MEGADPILSPEAVTWWWRRGLRVVSLVHYGQGPYAAGTGVEGGVTGEGRSLLAALEQSGMALDVTHLADRAMEEVLKSYGGPVLASHSNCRALVPGQRQLSDEQIAALVRRGAVIGMVCDAWMLYPGWVRGETQPEVLGIDSIADHVDHVCQISGSADHVGIGSDLDGLYGAEQTPRDLKSIADLARLGDIFARRGYSKEDIDALMWGNWLRFFRANLPAEGASS
jgi:membrane dipeptidase